MAPASTGFGDPVFVTVSVAVGVLTVVLVVLLLSAGLGSVVAEETVAVLVSTVPSGRAPTTTSMLMMAVWGAKSAFEQETVPLVPTAGVVQLQPAGAESAWKVVPAGNGSLTTVVMPSFGPSFETESV